MREVGPWLGLRFLVDWGSLAVWSAKMSARHAHLALLFGVLACQGPGGVRTVFTSVDSTGDPGNSSSGTTAVSAIGGTSGGSATAAGTTGAGTTGAGTTGAGTTSEASTTSADTGTASEATGSDAGDGRPVGCDGKIDFLFIISSELEMSEDLDFIKAAYPLFIETIQDRFAAFDYHIMVTDGSPHWGSYACEDACTPDGCPAIPDYPCNLLDLVTPCSETLGAGSVFPAGFNASNTPCKIAGGRRYMTKEQPNLAETFTCSASVGTYGWGLLGEALTAAVQPVMNTPGGCNEGFLRKDAMLMVITIGGYDEIHKSEGNPYTWRDSLLYAKDDDPDSIVLVEIHKVETPPDTCYFVDRICDFMQLFPHHLVNVDYSEMVEGFEAATDLVDSICEGLIPQ